MKTPDTPPLAACRARAAAALPDELQHPTVLTLIQLAFAEDLTPDADLRALAADLPAGDVTSASTLAPDSLLKGRIFAKQHGVVAGLLVAAAAFQFVHPGNVLAPRAADGDQVAPGDLLAEVSGPAPALLAAERPALNFLGRMSGTATLTRQFAEAVAGTRAVVLDTRKTAPGFRLLDKYAVRMGGGRNHRMGLYDMAMIKDNHIDGAGSIHAAVERVRARHGRALPIEVEVKDLAELETALALAVDRIMLDNMSLDDMRVAVRQVGGCTPLEASGNVSLQTVRAIAETGVDYISSGALTHSAPVFDVSMRVG